MKRPRDLTEWMPTNGLRPNARLSLTRMLIGGEYRSSTGRFYNDKTKLNSLFQPRKISTIEMSIVEHFMDTCSRSWDLYSHWLENMKLEERETE